MRDQVLVSLKIAIGFMALVSFVYALSYFTGYRSGKDLAFSDNRAESKGISDGISSGN